MVAIWPVEYNRSAVAQSVPAALPGAADCRPPMVYLEVVRHPAGGYTHAEPIDATQSTQRIYRGWWRTRRAARRALDAKFSYHAS